MQKFFVNIKCYIIKTNSWKKLLWWEIEIPRKQPPHIVQELSKVIHFQKFSTIGSTGSRVLLLVIFQALMQKWLHQSCFLGNLPTVSRTSKHHRFYRLIFLVKKATLCQYLIFALMRYISPKTIFLQTVSGFWV